MKKHHLFISVFMMISLLLGSCFIAAAETEPASAVQEETSSMLPSTTENVVTEAQPEASPATVAEEKPASVLLVIPNLATINIDLKSIYLASNSIREEASSISPYRMVNHKPLFEKMKNTETREELIALSKEMGAEKAVLGILKTRRRLHYLFLELYNLKTDQVEKKLNTIVTSLEPIELRLISRGAVKELLTIKN